MKRLLASALLLSSPGITDARDTPGADSRAEILRHLVVYEAPGEYCAWPSIVRTGGKELLLLFCRTEEHLAPNGAILQSRSTDNGVTWLSPEVLLDTPIDDRECGITPLRNGAILGHFWSTFHTKKMYEALAPDSYERPLLRRWIRQVQKPRYLAAKPRAGGSSSLSTDGGRTWSAFFSGHDAVHGGLDLSGGGILLASYRDAERGIVVRGADSVGGPWRELASIHSPRPDSLAFGEPHLVELTSGRVLMMIRATAIPYDDADGRCVLWESTSSDAGRTWTTPFPTPLWGFPPHLLRLSDGRVLCTYGYRRPPFGERACISEDGINWRIEDEIVLRDDAPNGDLGYPASVELEPGIILTVYYQANVPRGTIQRMKPPDGERTKPGILGTVWRVPPRK